MIWRRMLCEDLFVREEKMGFTLVPNSVVASWTSSISRVDRDASHAQWATSRSIFARTARWYD
jgi:hypothetical protein